MYRVEFYCPRSGKLYWQPLTEGLIFKTPRRFPSLDAAAGAIFRERLVYAYHSVRVIDPYGQVVYQV